MAERRLRVALGGDDTAHALLMRRLADDAAGDGEDLDERREYVGDGLGAPLLRSSERPRATTAPSGRPTYRRQRLGPAPAGYAAVFVEMARVLLTRADVALLLLDEDGKPERRADRELAERALREVGLDEAVMGLCCPIAEAWLVALIAPHRPSAYRSLSAELGFDPAREPHRLTAAPSGAKHHAKRALHFLLDSKPRLLSQYPSDTPKGSKTEPALWQAIPRYQITQTRPDCGLVAFYDQLLASYVPRISSKS